MKGQRKTYYGLQCEDIDCPLAATLWFEDVDKRDQFATDHEDDTHHRVELLKDKR